MCVSAGWGCVCSTSCLVSVCVWCLPRVRVGGVCGEGCVGGVSAVLTGMCVRDVCSACMMAGVSMGCLVILPSDVPNQ